MFLEQIEAKLRRLQDEYKRSGAVPPQIEESSARYKGVRSKNSDAVTVAIRVPKPMYQKLQAVAERFGLSGVREAMFVVLDVSLGLVRSSDN